MQTKNDDRFIDRKNIFKKPCIKEIQSYCNFRKNNIDANVFFDFYEAVGWRVGKTDMYDWKAMIRVWESRNKQKTKTVKNTEKKEVQKINYSNNKELEKLNELRWAEFLQNITVTDEQKTEVAGLGIEKYKAIYCNEVAQ